MMRKVVATNMVVKSSLRDTSDLIVDAALRVKDLERAHHEIGERLREVGQTLRYKSWREFSRDCGLEDTHLKKIADSGKCEIDPMIAIARTTCAHLDYIILGEGPVGGDAFRHRVNDRLVQIANKMAASRDRPSGAHQVTPGRPKKT